MPFMHIWPDFRLSRVGTKISFIWSSDKGPICKWMRFKRCWFDPWVGKIPWRRKWQTHSSICAWKIPWAEESGGYSPWGHKESEMTEYSNNINYKSYLAWEFSRRRPFQHLITLHPFSFLKRNIYIFMWLCWVLFAEYKLLVMAHGI